MGTRSNIGKLDNDGNVKFLYCQFDGYVEHVGVMLSKYYTEEATILELLSLGDMSSLNESIMTSVFYMRDRGEDDCPSRVVSLEEYADTNKDHVAYKYLHQYGEWHMRPCYLPETWRKVSEVIKENEEGSAE
jgi:hypothetical protein